MAITSQLEIEKKNPVNIETGAVGSGDGARLLSVPKSSIHWVRVEQGCSPTGHRDKTQVV